MYHESFILLSCAEENDGLLQVAALPDEVLGLFDSYSKKPILKKVLSKLISYRLLIKNNSQTYSITDAGKKKLQAYKIYIQQQHQKGPNYYIEPMEQPMPPAGNMDLQALIISIGTALGLFRNAS